MEAYEQDPIHFVRQHRFMHLAHQLNLSFPVYVCFNEQGQYKLISSKEQAKQSVFYFTLMSDGMPEKRERRASFDGGVPDALE